MWGTPLFFQISIFMVKDQLTSKLAGIILQYARMKEGRLTRVSDMCRINRNEFNIRGLSCMKFHRLVRLIYALHLDLGYHDSQQLVEDIKAALDKFAYEYDENLFDA
jgi:hypothetical protein